MFSLHKFIGRVMTGVMCATAVFSVLLPSIVRAASLYTSSVSTATVGTAITPTLSYTVDTALQTWANSDTLTVTLPANFPAWSAITFSAEYDTDTTNNAVGETAIALGSTDGTYAISGNVMTIKWNATGWGAAINGASTVRVVVTAGLTPQYSDVAAFISFGGTTAAADTEPSGFAFIVVSAAAAAATVTLAGNSVVGAFGNTALAFTTPLALANTATVVLVMPANFDVSLTATSTATTGFTGGGSFACWAVSATRTVTCTLSGAVDAGTGIINITAITSKYVATSQTVDVTVKNAAGNTLATTAAATITNTTAADAAGMVILNTNSVVGATGNTVFIVTIPTALEVGSTIAFGMPGNIDASQVAYYSETFTGAGEFSSCTASGQTVTCTANGVVNAGMGTITMTGIKSWFVASSQTVSGVVVKDLIGNTQASSSGGDVTDTTVGDLTSAGVTFQTNVGENTGTATISLTSTVTSTLAIPNGGKILVTFPSGYVLTGANGVTGSSLSGVNGTWTSSLSGQVLTLTQSAGATSTAGALSVTVTGIKNPSAISNTGTFSVATQTAAGAAIQSGTAAAVSVININFNNTIPQVTVPEPAPVVIVPAPTTTVVPTTSTVVVSPIVVPTTPVTAPVKNMPVSFGVSADALKALATGKFESKIAQQASPTIAVDLQIVASTSLVSVCAANTLIKISGNSAVYFCGADGKRYVFPSSQIYKSWYSDFSSVKTVSGDQLATLPIGGNVKYRPGITMIKLQSDPRVYVVAPGGLLRWVSSEGVATRLFGAQWNKQIQDVSDAFISNYSMGASLTE